MNFPVFRITRITGLLLMALIVIAPSATTSPLQPLPVAAAATPETAIAPVGYNIVDGKQDADNPIENPDLLNAPGYDSTSPSLGTHWSLEQIIDSDDRQQIEDTTSAPYRWVGRIDFTSAHGRKAHCSGALIASDTVLTAGHCLLPGAANFTFSPGLNADTAIFPIATATQIWRDKNYLHPGADWGIIKLDKPVGDEVGWFGMTTPTDDVLQGNFATVIGYPGDKQAGTLWQNRNKVIGFTSKSINYTADTFNGQSGGPVVDDNAVIYAIHNGGGRNNNGGQRITADLFSVIVNVSELS